MPFPMPLSAHFTVFRLPFAFLLVAFAILCADRRPTCGDEPTNAPNQPATEERDLYSDSWTGVDALGRVTPTHDDVGNVKTDRRRVVGIFYITWHGKKNAKLPAPYAYDITRVLESNPDARLDARAKEWGNYWGYFHWGEPELGYFLSDDEYVIRKDMSALVDAGIDALVLDATNGVLYWDEWEKLFNVMEQMKREGNRVPKICFWSFNGSSISVVQKIYEAYYKKGRFQDLWLYWDGKPLLLYNASPFLDSYFTRELKHPNPNYDPDAKTNPDNPHYGDPDYCDEFYRDYTKEVKEFFTLRNMWFGFYKWNNKRFVGEEDNWSYGYDLCDSNVLKMTPDELVSKHNGVQEEAAVDPAQHAYTLVGKSWSRRDTEPALNEYDLPVAAYDPRVDDVVSHPEGRGIYYQERWDEALAAEPQFIFIADWNEWTAIKYDDPKYMTEMNFMRRGKDATYYFVDQYNAEFNRTIQPMKGGYTDNYYMQTVANIRRYKGARPIPETRGYVPTPENAERALELWDALDVEYRDSVGDVFHRDALGYSGERYVDESGRNDFKTCKVAIDAENLYFMAETVDAITPWRDPNWLVLLIDADADPTSGRFGYDYALNLRVESETETTLSAWRDGEWREVAKVEYAVRGNRFVAIAPRAALGTTQDEFDLDFKWSDNATNLDDAITIAISGDAAPNRRFNYRLRWRR